ncbi:hypothetical protein [Lichenicoccus sp.]|uniref:hypothetical protein n=1 Tax=Lichenicoccus sp. TaxID=2781899 RepID=UPI003D0D2575
MTVADALPCTGIPSCAANQASRLLQRRRRDIAAAIGRGRCAHRLHRASIDGKIGLRAGLAVDAVVDGEPDDHGDRRQGKGCDDGDAAAVLPSHQL